MKDDALKQDRKFIAHISNIDGIRTEQTVAEHLKNTAEYAGNILKNCGLYHCGYLAGIIHDMGKYKKEFADYLEDAYNGKEPTKGLVNHTFAGVIYLLERYHTDSNDDFERLTSELLAFAAGSHHGEFDIIDPDGNNGFEHRLNKERTKIGYDEAKRNYRIFISEDKIDELFYLAKEETKALIEKLSVNEAGSGTKINFLIGLTARMVLSAVIEGDRRDTAEFMSGKKFQEYDVNAGFWQKQLDYFEHQAKENLHADSPINKARQYFSDQCLNFAKREGGIYRISVPTGAGKTLCMLRYALAHAKNQGKKRIIFIIPLLSVLDQNSKVIREYIEDNNIIQEFHSNVVNLRQQSEKMNEYELLSESWDKPVVISTLVQLLNILFTDKTSAIRRMSSLCGSVIVIDEVQSLPVKMTDMFNTAINYLAYYCNVTVVLSSATQPCFDKTGKSLRFSENPDIIPYEKDIFDVFKRTDVIDKTNAYGISADELVDFSVEIMENCTSLLVICNTKASALALYKKIELLNNNYHYNLFHLSTSMCMQHREDVLEEIKACLASRMKTVCISTQLVETGVDFSFECVIRVLAGMDNVTQAAGRCNRSGDFGRICKVYTVKLRDGDENLQKLREIKIAQDCSVILLDRFSKHPENYDHDLLSQKSIAEYYELLYKHPEVEMKLNYPVNQLPGGISLYNMLSMNTNFSKRAEKGQEYILKQSFKTANSEFTVFDENTTDVIVPYNNEAKEIIANLCSKTSKFDYNYMKEQMSAAKKYTIQIYEHQKRELDGLLYSDSDGHFIALTEMHYDKKVGLSINYIN